ncbi:hypothetical protein FRC08_012171 [Ceratobasidium sp. 394]|nr:hypothetical protein FRC08_012171 [Ceratobasidium sp. 394]KAG9075071.1 hypothetical protein FS749_013303 [Ceratobasidium sp. UAMH 11750]
MPAANPADQQAARAIEASLREAVTRCERPKVELDWLLALPKRIRRSGKLLEAAQMEARVLLDHVRAAWAKTAAADREREERLTRARALPRDLECLRAPDPTAWNGLGRRKKRCRAFEAVGRAYTTRKQHSPPVPAANSDPVDIFLLHPASCHRPKRPLTPPGLRDEVRNIPNLIYAASGPANPADYGLPTPCTPSPAPSPPPPEVMRCPPSPHPPPQPVLACEGETIIDGEPVDCRLAYLMALGSWEGCRSAVPPSLGQAAERVLDTDSLQPGVLDALLDIFFPHGLDDWTLARPKLVYLRDFILGWYALAPWPS